MACVAGVLFASPAGAGLGIYDMTRLLFEPHPFDIVAPPAPAEINPAAGRVYDTTPAVGEPRPSDYPSIRPRPGRGAAFELAPGSGPSVAARGAPPRIGAEPAFLHLALGVYDVNDNEDAAEFRVEWRDREWWWKLKPLAGVMATSDAAIYVYGGLAADFDLGRRFVLTPSLAAGLYEDGSGKDLGSVIAFRSGLELAWRLEDGARVGLMFYHLSNAGIDDRNPGTEVLSLGYAIPLN